MWDLIKRSKVKGESNHLCAIFVHSITNLFMLSDNFKCQVCARRARIFHSEPLDLSIPHPLQHQVLLAEHMTAFELSLSPVVYKP